MAGAPADEVPVESDEGIISLALPMIAPTEMVNICTNKQIMDNFSQYTKCKIDIDMHDPAAILVHGKLCHLKKAMVILRSATPLRIIIEIASNYSWKDISEIIEIMEMAINLKIYKLTIITMDTVMFCLVVEGNNKDFDKMVAITESIADCISSTKLPRQVMISLKLNSYHMKYVIYFLDKEFIKIREKTGTAILIQNLGRNVDVLIMGQNARDAYESLILMIGSLPLTMQFTMPKNVNYISKHVVKTIRSELKLDVIFERHEKTKRLHITLHSTEGKIDDLYKGYMRIHSKNIITQHLKLKKLKLKVQKVYAPVESSEPSDQDEEEERKLIFDLCSCVLKN